MMRIRFGCAAMAFAALGTMATDAGAAPTYAKDVAPILNANCVSCHRPGQIGPMSLRTYNEVRPWVKSIAQNVQQGKMPPWHADPAHGEFANDRSLDPAEVETIVAWANAGARRGDPSDMPPAPAFEDAEWSLGTPDLVLAFDEVSLPAGGPDRFYDLTVETNLDEDKWVRAIEVRPSNRKVAHHVIVFQADGGNQGWLGAWAAGMQPMQFPEGTGRLLKKGATLVGDMHYHPADTPEIDQTELGIYFSEDNAVDKELINLWIQNNGFRIPAGEENYEATASYTFRRDSIIHSMLPHMHYRGKDFTYTAKYPDGTEEVLLQVNNYDFNWQTHYTLAEPKEVPQGTTLECVAHWDNSENNPFNPDPTKDVYFGSESFNEMMIGFVDYVVADGQSLGTPAEQISSITKSLIGKPGQIFTTTIKAPGNEDYPGVLHLKPDGDHTWYLVVMGTVYEADFEDLAWNANTFTGEIDIRGVGDFAMSAAIVDNGAFLGTVNAEGFKLKLSGQQVQ